MMQGKKRPPLQHQLLTKAISSVLDDVILRGQNMDKALEFQMKKHKHWNVFNRSYLYETCSDIIRNWRYLYTIAEAIDKKGVYHFKNLYAVWHCLRKKDMMQHPSLRNMPVERIMEKLGKYRRVFRIRESYPDWLDEWGRKELGNIWEKTAIALSSPPVMFLRANTLKCTRDELLQYLTTHHTEAHPVEWSPDAIMLPFRRNVFRLEMFKAGWFEVQDASSQMVAEFMELRPGMRVLDACAGRGGKSLHIAALMKNKGRLLSLDNQSFKLDELKKRAARAGAAIVETRAIDSSKTIKRLAGSMDRVLLDVPCSGTGVFRRNPDAKWHLQPAELESLKQTQEELLERFASTVKNSGKLIYATCSIFPSEGEEQIRKFLAKHKNEWELEAEKRYDVSRFNADGFYMARLKKC